MRPPRSLRFRLVAAAVVTAVLGMVVVNVVAVLTLRGNLLQQVDSELSAFPLTNPRNGPRPLPSGAPTSGTAVPQPAPTGPSGSVDRFFEAGSDSQFLDDRVIARLDPTTGERLSLVIGPGLDGVAEPDLTELTDQVAAGRVPQGLVWIPDTDGNATAYRARVVTSPNGVSEASVVVVAKSLSDLNSTMARVALVDAAVSAVVVLGLIGLGVVLVRVGLRPLSDVEESAEQIAAGDLSVRAPHAGEQTEVGSLSRTFNTMVDAVTSALAERDASERMMRQVLADASHELRTPVTSIRAWAELVRRGAVPAETETREAVRRIEIDAERMGVLVDDLLLLARLDQHPDLRPEEVDLATVAQETAASLSATVDGHTLRVEGSDVHVVADEEAVRRILGNLIRNALVHTPDGTTVLVETGRHDGRARITVSDDGPGMPEDVAAHVFDRFYRPDTGRSRKVAGSGLGLAIVRSLVRSHGGEVSLKTRPGDGARFTVDLPIDGPTPQAPSQDPTAFPKVTGSRPDA